MSTRSRIIRPNPPVNEAGMNNAPARGPGAEAVVDSGAPTERSAKASDKDVVRAGGSMAIATLLSRMTGFLRNVAIGATMGPAISSAFNTANTLPNLITEIVLGAVLTSLVVPVLVRAEKEDPDGGAEFIRRMFTLSATLLVGVTLLAILGAPLLTRLMLDTDGKVNLIQSTSFAYLLLPQILFYGMFSLFMAVLNTKSVFRPGAWAPVANNVVVLCVLGLYWTLPGGLTPDAPAGVTDPHILLLGVGTTLGVVVQALILLPSLKRLKIDLRPLWGIDHRLKQFGGMALAIVVYVAISQLGYVVTTRIASMSSAGAPIIYQQAWLLLQVPYGIIGVTLLTAIMPRLSRNAADGDHRAVVHDLTQATKITLLSMIPVIVFFTVFGPQLATALFAYGAFDATSAGILGLTLSFSSFTLIPYAIVLLHLRVFYAREEAWTPTYIIAGITATKVLLSLLAPMVANSDRDVVILLGAANGFGFISGAVIGSFLLRRKLGPLNGRSIARTTAWSLGASIAGVIVAVPLVRFAVQPLLDRLLPDQGMGRSLSYLLYCAVAGTVFLATVALVLSRSKLEELAVLDGVKNRLRRGRAQEAPELVELPPLSVGEVRIPRLLPGAPIANGAFRLLSNHGEIAGEHGPGEGAKLWVASEGDKRVAIAFAHGIHVEATRALAKHCGVRVRIFPYRDGHLVVSPWRKGVDLVDAEERELISHAELAQALQPFDALPLASAQQLRLTPDGVVLAFPLVFTEDLLSLGVDVAGLAAATNAADCGDPASGEESDCFELPVSAGFAHRAFNELTDLDMDEVAEVEQWEKPGSGLLGAGETQPVPVPPLSAGFGSRGYSTGGKLVLASAVMIVVFSGAALVWLMLGRLGGPYGPVASDPIASVAPKVVQDSGRVATVVSARHWPGSEQLAVSKEDPWVALDAEGVALTLETPIRPTKLSLEAQGVSTKVSVFGVQGNTPPVLLGEGMVGGPDSANPDAVTEIGLSADEEYSEIIVWVSPEPVLYPDGSVAEMPGEGVRVSQLTVAGK